MMFKKKVCQKSFWIFLTVFLTLFQGIAFSRQYVRKPAVAGKFYPDNPLELRQQIETFLDLSVNKSIDGKIRALIVPHAGYVFSGIVAGAGYKLIRHANISQVILIGPSHHVDFKGASIANVTHYETPLGLVKLSPNVALIKDGITILTEDQAHAREHCLEVQLPFLQETLNDFQIIPILTGRVDPSKLARQIEPLIDDQTLIIASSDLSHYYPYNIAKSKDLKCISSIISFSQNGIKTCEACGIDAIQTLMNIALAKGWHSQLIDYRNSGDTAGPKDKVVGYATIAFYEGKSKEAVMSSLDQMEKKELLTLARSAIESNLIKDKNVIRPESPTNSELQKRGCFVTLHKNGELRGCIGTIEPVDALIEGIYENALNAAFRDPRFRPVKADELEDIKIEISVLTSPKLLEYTDSEDLLRKLKPGVHGVIISKGWHRATFLPQVWDQLPDSKMFLRHLCQKAQLPADAWKDNDLKVSVYEVEYFSE